MSTSQNKGRGGRGGVGGKSGRGGRGGGKGGRGGGRGKVRGGGRGQQRQKHEQNSKPNNTTCKGTVLVLHGNRQTGQLLLGRMTKLQKRLWNEFQIDMVAPDAPLPHPEDSQLRTWWNRKDNYYDGLNESLDMIQKQFCKTTEENHDEKSNKTIVGILGFSQGARLTHILATLHTMDPQRWFPNLNFVIVVAGYDAPVPDNLLSSSSSSSSIGPMASTSSTKIRLASLHVWGVGDSLITPDQSESLIESYDNSSFIRLTYAHDGKHYVPMKAPDVKVYIDFIQHVQQQSTSLKDSKLCVSSSSKEKAPQPSSSIDSTSTITTIKSSTTIASTGNSQQSPLGNLKPDKKVDLGKLSAIPQEQRHVTRDDECAVMQREEVQVLEAMFPDEFQLLSSKRVLNEDFEEYEYGYPLIYQLKVLPLDDDNEGTNWPPHPLTLHVTCPYDYPQKSIPIFKLVHNNTVYEFESITITCLLDAANEKAKAELELEEPSVLVCLDAVREFLDSPETVRGTTTTSTDKDEPHSQSRDAEDYNEESDGNPESGISHSQKIASVSTLIKESSPDKIKQSNIEGLKIAEDVLIMKSSTIPTADTQSGISSTKGGSFPNYTIGLVGKPSAGKSTFFNAATAFGRQRGGTGGDKNDGDSAILGGASMAPHPFTTIDPNIGYCLIPAPEGSCPEDGDKEENRKMLYGSTHGRDAQGRRFIPVLLKDVAGLVPGAYQGRGRGNQFLNDLCDATVLIHVVDASGTADAQGNKTVTTDDDSEYTNPLDDLAWIRNELVEWVYTNLTVKWDTIQRKGRSKLLGMFSGYGQTQAVVENIFSALEKFLEEHQQRDHALEKMHDWDQADVHRLVSAFLGVRFPMALALNKCDLPSSSRNVEAIQEALPIHGAYVGTSLTAKSEMNFVRAHLMNEFEGDENTRQIPTKVWRCLTSAMMLQQPLLVFPVSDMVTYAPLAGMDNPAVGDPSLPSPAMVTCIKAAGGIPPSCWEDERKSYVMPNNKLKTTDKSNMLRDILLMKPGSTVEDVFLTLKRHGALCGEFVRAEGAGEVGEKPKPIPKLELIGKHNRILKIMSNRRTAWQT